MKSDDIYLEAAQLKDQIQQLLYHPYLFKYIEPPHIDDDKLLLLCSLTPETDSLIRKETIVSSMLVQIALDMHERILLIDLTSDNHKLRQLTVLAGDYYSSLYYERLSAINERRLTRLLADGIRLINELKTQLLYAKDLNVDQILKIKCNVENNVINQFSIATNGKELPLFVQELLLLKRLINEKSTAENGQPSLWINLFGRQLNRIYSTPDKIELLSKKENIITLKTIDSTIRNTYYRVEEALAKSNNKIVNFIFENQKTLLNEMAKLANSTFSKEG